MPLYEVDDPTALWQRLLVEFGDVAPVELEPGVTAWLLLSWEANRRVLCDPHTFARDPRRWRELNDGTIPPESPLHALYQPRRNAVSVDGKAHQRYRRALVDALARLPRERIVHHVDDAADRLVDGFCAHGKADLIGQYASVLPLMALSRLFGMEERAGAELCASMQRLWDGGADAAEAYARVQALLLEVAVHRRRRPGIDLASGMIAHGLDDVEVRDQLALIMAVTDDPVTHLIGNTLRTLLTDRNLRMDLAGSQRLISETVNAALWRDPPVHTVVGRYPTRNVRLGGFDIAAGDCLVIGFAPAHQELLRRGDLKAASGNRAHLTWGAGSHACPSAGRDIALAMAENAVQQLLHRLPDLHLAVPTDALTWRSSTAIRGLLHFPVRFTPTAPVNEGNPVWTPRSSRSGSAPPTSTPTPRHRRSARPGRWLGWLSPGAWRPGR